MRKIKFEFEVDGLTDLEIEILKTEMRVALDKKLAKIRKQSSTTEKIDPQHLITSEVVDYSLPVNEWLKNMKTFENKVSLVNDAAKKAGKLTGRILQIPIGDGYAYYQVLEKNGDEALVSVITGIGDDWIVPDLGHKSKINLSRVKAYLMRCSDEQFFRV